MIGIGIENVVVKIRYMFFLWLLFFFEYNVSFFKRNIRLLIMILYIVNFLIFLIYYDLYDVVG